MSEKKLKQTRLPFQILTSPKTPTTSSALPPKSIEKSSSPSTPKTPKPISSRKRKPSSEGENLRSTKIGRLTNAKENIAESETIELIDSDDNEKDQNVSKTLNKVETTPTTTSNASESVIHIKLPSTTKSRRKQDLKATKSVEEIEENDDSIVYLDNVVASKSIKKVKKSAKKSEKKKKEKSESNDDEGIERVKKTLELNDDEKVVKESEVLSSDDEEVKEEAPKSPSNDPVEENPSKSKEESSKVDEQPMEVDNNEPQPAESTVSDQISKLIDASGVSSSPVKDIQDILSDDEDETSPNDQSLNTSLNTSLNQSVDNKGTPKHLTPKALARRKELEEKRLEKELQKKKEREAKELQRLKEKEQREEAKRREKEEKEELRRKEKEEKEVRK